MSDTVRRFLVAYDITNDKRRARLASLLESFGYRAQYSVFVIDIDVARAVRLWLSIEHKIVSSEDSVLICDLGPTRGVNESRFRYIGQRRPVEPDGPLIL